MRPTDGSKVSAAAPLPPCPAPAPFAPSAGQGHAWWAEATEVVYAAAYQCLAAQRYEDATRLFSMLVQAVPMDERGWVGLGTCHARLDSAELALHLFGAGIVATACPVRCLLGRVRCWRALCCYDQAAAELQEAERIAGVRQDPELLALVERERASQHPSAYLPARVNRGEPK